MFVLTRKTGEGIVVESASGKITITIDVIDPSTVQFQVASNFECTIAKHPPESPTTDLKSSRNNCEPT